LERLANKSITKDELLEDVKQNFRLLPEILNGVSSSKAAIRYGCVKVLMDLSDEQPEKLYPHMDLFISLLDSKYRILTWNAMAIIANLTEVDTENKFDAIFDRYFSFLNDEYMVTVANLVGNAGTIATKRPNLTQKITDELLKVEKISITLHLTEECKNVVTEKTIKSFDLFFNQIENKDEVISFVKRQINNTRKSVRIESEKFLKKWNQKYKKIKRK
jgi:hypothetical protein